MVIYKNDIANEVKRQLDSTGLNLNLAVVKLIIDSTYECMKESLANGDEVCIDGVFTARTKVRAYRDPAGRGRMHTVKIDASIDEGFKSEMMYKKNIINDTGV